MLEKKKITSELVQLFCEQYVVLSTSITGTALCLSVKHDIGVLHQIYLCFECLHGEEKKKSKTSIVL